MFQRLFLPLLIWLPAAPVSADPLTLPHAFGETRLDPEAVERIVSVGYHEQDFLYALGLAPVGVHEWFGNQPYATWPWAEAARKAAGAEPEVQKGFEIDVEWVWSLEPDLIIASFAPMDAQLYAQLSEIAPVIGPPAGFPAWGATWEEELRLIARATGRDRQATEVIAALGAQIAQAKQDYPEFAGTSGTMAHFAEGQVIGYRRSDGANRLLASLGIETPAEFDSLTRPGGNFPVSPERMDIFDLDVLIWLVDPASRATITALPSWRNTRAAREGRAIWADEQLMGAMSFQSPLSISWGLTHLLPQIAVALDGDPATPSEAEQ